MSILLQIKEQTRPEHDRLESRLNLLRPDLTVNEYKEILCRFWGLYKPFESEILKHQLPLDYSDRLKSPLIRKDLLSLGMSEEEVNALPLCEKLSSLTNSAEVMGALYVVEGSTLGGQVLLKHFSSTLGLSKFFFFAGYGELTVPKWREFQGHLLSFSEENPSKNEVLIQNAKKMFTTIEEWLLLN